MRRRRFRKRASATAKIRPSGARTPGYPASPIQTLSRVENPSRNSKTADRAGDAMPSTWAILQFWGCLGCRCEVYSGFQLRGMIEQ